MCWRVDGEVEGKRRKAADVRHKAQGEREKVKCKKSLLLVNSSPIKGCAAFYFYLYGSDCLLVIDRRLMTDYWQPTHSSFDKC